MESRKSDPPGIGLAEKDCRNCGSAALFGGLSLSACKGPIRIKCSPYERVS
jgi:hypothetical protein